VGQGLTDTLGGRGGKESVKTAIAVRGGGEIKTASAVFGPRLAGEGRVEGDDEIKLAGMDGVGGKVKGHAMQTMVSREQRERD
jgi:hypothetical protein